MSGCVPTPEHCALTCATAVKEAPIADTFQPIATHGFWTCESATQGRTDYGPIGLLDENRHRTARCARMTSVLRRHSRGHTIHRTCPDPTGTCKSKENCVQKGEAIADAKGATAFTLRDNEAGLVTQERFCMNSIAG